MLEALNISFEYGARSVISDVSLVARPGEVVAVAGANGAGKTTLLRILAGLAHPSAGTVRANRSDIFLEQIRYRRIMGYLGEAAGVEDDLCVRAYLKYRARMRGEQSRKIRHRVEEAMERCGITHLAEREIATLSFGERKRTALADAILLRPRFLILDDVFAGLDPATRVKVAEMVASVTSFASVIIAGHEIDDFAGIARRFLVLKDAHLYEAANVHALREALA